MEAFDLVVVGAGITGLAVAKTFHQVHPDKKLVVLEESATPGGVWAAHRLYPGLRTNNMLGTYEYPDFPMDSAVFGVQPGEHIPGEVMHAYLNAYAEKFGIRDKIRCRTRVLSAEHQDGNAESGWTLAIAAGAESAQSSIFARKLVVATGLTSEPSLPTFAGQEDFGVPLYHSKDFAQYADSLTSATTVAVFGGTKSAWDVAYQYAIKGVKVDWVIRESGHGPVWMAPPYVTPLKRWLEKLVHTRLLTWFSPCIWGDADGYGRVRSFLHSTALGRTITNTFWSILSNDLETSNQYSSHPEMQKLKPWSEAMFTASSLSILNYPTNFFDLVKNGTIRVHIADITRLSRGKIHLSDGAELQVDTLCCATGWKHLPPLKFFPEGIDAELGIPHRPSASEPLLTPQAVKEADEEILKRFPRLKDQHQRVPDENAPELTPYTLYRFVVPPSARLQRSHDIAFVGAQMNITVTTIAHAQAVWIVAYLYTDKNAASTDEKSLAELQRETLLHARFGRWRHHPAGHGAQFPDFVFDALPYLDLLMRDLKVPVHRKRGWFSEAMTPYGPEDYRDLIAEWQAANATVARHS